MSVAINVVLEHEEEDVVGPVCALPRLLAAHPLVDAQNGLASAVDHLVKVRDGRCSRHAIPPGGARRVWPEWYP